MEDKTVQQSGALALICPTCGARYTLPKYVEGQKYGCKRCSASLMFGKFALQQELGRGGFGVVYKAFQADLQRVVALKFLHSDSEESTERFMREARIAANLSHPNIIAIHEVGQHDGKPYITMQFIDGITTNKASFSIREAVFVMRDAAIAVDYAHARDVIHRDIKPHNIMVTQERSGTSAGDTTRRTFVMDFGLARSANKGGTLTTEGQVMGTPAFMSPEQAEGKSCDLRSDVYSLGATLFSLVTKRPPFEAPTPLQILMQVTQEDPPAPSSINPEIDKGLEAIILKAMAKDAAHRYPTASRFAQDLTSWLAGGVTDAGPTVHLSMTPGALKAARRKKSGTMVLVGALLILAGGGGLAWKILSKPNPEPTSVAHNPVKPTPPVVPSNPPPPPPSATVLLEIVTEPADAVVRIDNSNREYRSPVSLNDSQIGPGLHEIVISKHGYQIVKEPVTVTPGGSVTKVSKKLELEARKVAFVLESTPPGARILLNDTDTGATTPQTIYQDDVGGLAAKVVLVLEGYQSATRRFPPNGLTQQVELKAKTGSYVLTSAAAGATIHLFALPDSIKNAHSVAGLWSENPEQLVQAVNGLDDADVSHVVDRLKVLKPKADARIREKLATLSARAPSSTPVKPEKSTTADDRGVARLAGAGVLNRYRIFATSARTQDYLSGELTPRDGIEDSINIETITLALVTAKSVRPAVGKFRVIQADQKEAGFLSSGSATGVRVMVGKVVLQFVPPENDPLLRDFSVQLLKEPYELGGNLYQYAGEAHKTAGNALLAVRAYSKALEEKTFPPSEQPERANLPELIRGLYKGWIDEAVAKGRSLGGDLAGRLEEAKRKAPEEAFLHLVELYAARDAGPAVRGGAAAELASLLGKQKQAYEALEWAERCVKEKFEPGQDTVTLLSVLVKGAAGLQPRWDLVVAGIEAARKAAQAKPDPPVVVPLPAAGGKVGVLKVTSVGIFLKLDPDTQVAKGDILEVFREGALVGEVLVTSLHGPDVNYPNGSAGCRKGTGTPAKDDEVRRKK